MTCSQITLSTSLQIVPEQGVISGWENCSFEFSEGRTTTFFRLRHLKI
jgi:hypothetical protein